MPAASGTSLDGNFTDKVAVWLTKYHLYGDLLCNDCTFGASELMLSNSDLYTRQQCRHFSQLSHIRDLKFPMEMYPQSALYL